MYTYEYIPQMYLQLIRPDNNLGHYHGLYDSLGSTISIMDAELPSGSLQALASNISILMLIF